MLRHAAATLVRKALGDRGREAAKSLLGHGTLAITDRYAEVDPALALEAASRIIA